ncbi:MAG: DUF6364 family protein [Chloroflexota bacterium]|nr:DUF6364 family protein [Chloroflexota bacterium]
MAKVAKNLLLDEEAVERGERYSELHATTLSRLVSDFLQQLPVDEPRRDLSPTVRRLLGVAAGGQTDREAYRRHVLKKYGGR